MKHVTAEEAAAKLPELLEQLKEGDEVLLELDGKVVAKLSGMPKPKGPPYRKAGFAKGEIEMTDDFDDPIEGFEPYM